MQKKKGKRRFKVGQVVSLRGLNFYKSKARKAEQYQAITRINPWGGKIGGYLLTFANGDSCHEKWVKALSPKEAGYW